MDIRQASELRGTFHVSDPCAALRRASRAVTHLYDLVLAPTGLKSTQFIILRAIYDSGELPQWRFADEYGVSDDTLSRRLAILRKLGYVTHRIGCHPAGARLYRLTPLGVERYKEALPYWRRAESRLLCTLGESGLKSLLSAAETATVTAAAAESLKQCNGHPPAQGASAIAGQ